MQKPDDRDANAKETDTDQYQHFIPRFILRKYAQPDLRSVTVWDWWNDRLHVREIKNTFGMPNQYDSADNGNPYKKCVEKLFADLECDMGAILKKVECSLGSDIAKTGTEATLRLLESEVHTVYKFIGLAGFRNGPFGLSYNSGDDKFTKISGGGYREDWVKILEFLLKNSHKDLAEMDELLQEDIFRPTLAMYKQLSRMKLLFWITSADDEFLLSNLLAVHEGHQFPEVLSTPRKRVPAHFFLPMGPKVLLVLCLDSLCTQSMLSDAPHGITTSYDRPARGKLGKTNGPKRYQPVFPNWKTVYPITPISANHLYTINNLTLASGDVVVYKSLPTLEKTTDNILSFAQLYTTWRTRISCSGEEIEDPEQKAISELSYALLRIFRINDRLHTQSCEQEMHEELMHENEVIEKLLYYTLTYNTPPHILLALCKSGAY